MTIDQIIWFALALVGFGLACCELYEHVHTGTCGCAPPDHRCDPDLRTDGDA
jgi:hypothetical protein